MSRAVPNASACAEEQGGSRSTLPREDAEWSAFRAAVRMSSSMISPSRCQQSPCAGDDDEPPEA